LKDEDLNKLEEIVLSYPRLKQRIENSENPKKEREKALKNLDEIKADFSLTTIKTFEKALDATLAKLYDGINLEANGIDFKKLTSENSVVLVPNHQSHADYVAINYKVFKDYKIPLHVAGGNNLNIFPIGKLFRKSGCFFIRRSFQNDILYKITLEAYLYYLLMLKKPIEFFFEGGRSRTGKLLPPRFGLYQMLLEAHQQLPEDKKSPLLFLPVSIAHEYVPEQQSLARELRGGKKKKESTRQLFKLFKLLSYQFGNVHIHFGDVVQADPNIPEIKIRTQNLAFDCFRQVGRRMVVTPTSLLALVLLDEPTGALKWAGLLANCQQIIDYCKHFEIPLTDSLKSENWEKTLGRAMDILIANEKVDVIGKSKRGQVFYAIKEESRPELLYFKNTILHHFLVPWSITTAWFSLFNGSIQNVEDLKRHFLTQRDLLKHEFYLPTMREFYKKTVEVISWCIRREVKTFEECMQLTHKELYAILSHIGLFSRSCHYIYEAYYVSAQTLWLLCEEGKAHKEGIRSEEFEKRLKNVYQEERNLEGVIQFTESYSLPMMRNSLKYFTQQHIIRHEHAKIYVNDPDVLQGLILAFEEDLKEHQRFHLRANI
jgi:glycerol-3-phosphate O-acyltransferase